MKKILLALTITTLAVQFAMAQEVQIDGKSFQTVKKTVLNAETELYTLKEKGKSGQVGKSYIKTNNTYTETVFTESELKMFLKTGKLSSLGRVSNKQFANKAKVTFIDKGDIIIITWIKNSTLKFLEISDYKMVKKLNPSTTAKIMGGGGAPQNEDRENCMNDCGDVIVGDVNDPTDLGCIDEGNGACEEWFDKCLDDCIGKYPYRIKGEGLNRYSIQFKNISMKIKYDL